MTNIQAIDLLKDLEQRLDDYCELNDEGKTAFHMAITALEVFGNSEQLPSAQPDVPDINVGDINKFIDGLEEIFADIRERHGDDSVCGLCEYDGAYIGQSGDWYNECPGFDGDDCFKLSDKCRKEWIDTITNSLPSAQPEIIHCCDCKHYYYADNRIPQEQRYTCDLDGDRWSEDSFCSFAERREA